MVIGMYTFEYMVVVSVTSVLTSPCHQVSMGLADHMRNIMPLKKSQVKCLYMMKKNDEIFV
jgi:hypothetical protein